MFPVRINFVAHIARGIHCVDVPQSGCACGSPRVCDVEAVRADNGKLFFAPILGIDKPIDRLLAHTDQMAFKPHTACDLFWEPTGL